MTQDTRKDPRAKVVSLNVRYKSATIDDFIENHSHDVSRGGLFIKTSSPFVPGTLLKFEIRIARDQTVIAGVGRVVWDRKPEQAQEGRPAGMGVKFIKLDEASKALIQRLVASRSDAGRTFESESGQPRSEPPRPSSWASLGASATRLPVDSAPRKATISGLGAVKPASGSAPPMFTTTLPMFPRDPQPVPSRPAEEPTVMRQAAELLEAALKEAGGSAEEIGKCSSLSPAFAPTIPAAVGLAPPPPPDPDDASRPSVAHHDSDSAFPPATNEDETLRPGSRELDDVAHEAQSASLWTRMIAAQATPEHVTPSPTPPAGSPPFATPIPLPVRAPLGPHVSQPPLTARAAKGGVLLATLLVVGAAAAGGFLLLRGGETSPPTTPAEPAAPRALAPPPTIPPSPPSALAPSAFAASDPNTPSAAAPPPSASSPAASALASAAAPVAPPPARKTPVVRRAVPKPVASDVPPTSEEPTERPSKGEEPKELPKAPAKEPSTDRPTEPSETPADAPKGRTRGRSGRGGLGTPPIDSDNPY